MKLLLLLQNYEKYLSGYYHQDWVNALKKRHSCYLWGKGYSNYDQKTNINEVINLAKKSIGTIDFICIMSSWSEINSDESYNPEPSINLVDIEIPKIYFLNKEYKLLESKISYVKNNRIDLVISVLEDLKERFNFTNFLHLPFAVDIDRLKNLLSKKNIYKYDFAFTGALHSSYLDKRKKLKDQIIPKNKKFFSGNISYLNNTYKIYWAEWGSINLLTRQSRLPSGEKYFKFLSQCRSFLATSSAMGIIGTRFFELMILGSIPLVPDEEDLNDFGRNLIKDMNSCILFGRNTRSFYDALQMVVNDQDLIKQILLRNRRTILEMHTYENRLLLLEEKLNFLKNSVYENRKIK